MWSITLWAGSVFRDLHKDRDVNKNFLNKIPFTQELRPTTGKWNLMKLTNSVQVMKQSIE